MFKYCINFESDEPIMLLNKQIGMTVNSDGGWDGEEFIDGAEFQQELMQLDQMGKKRIQVWIVSPGGNVIQAMNIYSAILKSNTPVDTYNCGLCASSAGLIFMAGRKRFMSDYAQMMFHPVSGSDDTKMYEAFMQACAKMATPKSKLTEDAIRQMMNLETWLNADQCHEYGLCTDIESTSTSNKKYVSNDIKDLMSYSNNILNSKIKITPKMKKVTNKLSLNESANEDAICEAIDKLTNVANQATQTATDLQASLDEAKQRVTDLEAEIATATATIADQAEVAATSAATDVVNSFKNRIGDKPEVITRWVNLAKADIAGTKAMLEALPINSVAPIIPAAGGSVATKSMANIMHQINSKTTVKL